MIKKNKILKFFLVSFLPGLFLLSCVEDFEAKFELQDRILVIEGVLSDIEGEQYVTIRESIPSSQTSSYFKVISKAKVFVTDNTGNNIIFSERESGYYYPETGFKGEIGRTYQLEIELNDGTKLESDIQKLTKAPAIKNVYKTIDPEAVQVTATKTLPGHKIYVDYDDPKGVGDNYLWTWTLYEKQDACKTCYGGLYYRDPKPEGYC